jgi:hypothetical protein
MDDFNVTQTVINFGFLLFPGFFFTVILALYFRWLWDLKWAFFLSIFFSGFAVYFFYYLILRVSAWTNLYEGVNYYTKGWHIIPFLNPDPSKGTFFHAFAPEGGEGAFLLHSFAINPFEVARVVILSVPLGFISVAAIRYVFGPPPGSPAAQEEEN